VAWPRNLLRILLFEFRHVVCCIAGKPQSNFLIQANLRKPVAQTQHMDISFDIPESLEPPVERARIERVLLNLFTNSLEALGQGDQIDISATQNNVCAIVRVTDTGPGIPT
jgi:signal transduction histidine kinase